jgi:hypothetical protein
MPFQQTGFRFFLFFLTFATERLEQANLLQISARER